jgi:hypothetical protein
VPKINVYLPDDLAEAVKETNLPVSAVCQEALERAVRKVTALREPERGTFPDNQEWAGTRITFTRYTNRARRAVTLARQAASGADHIGTHHLLSGVLREENNLAIQVLQRLDINARDLEQELRLLALSSPEIGLDRDVGLSANACTALELASTERSLSGHSYIGCEHLLLGLIAEPDGVAGTALRQRGLELRITRRAVNAALSASVLISAPSITWEGMGSS